MNKGRFALGVLIAAVIYFMTDGFMHEVLIKSAWNDLFDALHFKPTGESKAAMLWFLVFEIGRAVIGMTFYVLLRPRIGAGAKTAALAGALSWFAFSFTGPPQMIPLQLMTVDLWIKMSGIQLVTSLIGMLAAAAPYKDA